MPIGGGPGCWLASEPGAADTGEDDDRLLAPDGTHWPVAGTRTSERVQTVYNLTVDTDHTYYVVAGDTP